MKGSAKQIAWAEDIKNNPIVTCDLNIERFAETVPGRAALYAKIKVKYTELIARIEQRPEADRAAWWIDNRDRLPSVQKIHDLVINQVGFCGKGEDMDEALKRLFGF